MRTLLLSVVAIAAGSASAAVVTSECQIVVPDAVKGEREVPHYIRQAADRLREALAEGAGVEVPVREASQAAAGVRSIWLGAAFAERAGLLTSDMTGHDNAYAEKGGDIYLFGRDRNGSPGKKRVDWQRCVLPTVRATVRFMEDVLDVRFLLPGRVGTDVPNVAKVEVADGTCSRERYPLVYGNGADDMLYGYASGQIGSGVVHTYGGHTYPSACPTEKYAKTHPEYFALVNGKRLPVKGNPALCISNPEVKRLVVEELLRRYDAGADICQLAQQDGGLFCQCEACEGLYGVGRGKAFYGEKFWRFHRDVAEEIARLRPGKIVNIISYGETANPPKTFRKFPENVMVEVCHPSQDKFDAWRAYDVPKGFFAYLYLWGNYRTPGMTAHLSFAAASRQARLLRDNNTRGIYRCGFGYSRGIEGPADYVYNRTLTDPALDVPTTVKDYCARAYGAASRHMMRFHETLDECIRGYNVQRENVMSPRDRTAVGTYGRVPSLSSIDYFAATYPVKSVKSARELLERAEKTKGLSEKERLRLQVVRAEFDYLENLVTMGHLYSAYRVCPTQALFDELAKTVEARRALIDSLCPGSGDPRPRPVAGWPELRLFGNCQKHWLVNNGRDSGLINAPAKWDIALLRQTGVLPGAAMKRITVRRTAGEPSATDFEGGEWAKAGWNDLGGIQLQRISKAARFKALAGEEAIYFAVESDLDDAKAIPRNGHDGPICGTESTDLFVDPTGSREVCYHFNWNCYDDAYLDEAQGLITDPLDPMWGKFVKWWDAKGVTFRNTRGGNRWKTLVKIPYAAIGAEKPLPNAKWCLNVAREWGADEHDNSRIVDALWSPNLELGGFCSLDALGEMVFE